MQKNISTKFDQDFYRNLSKFLLLASTLYLVLFFFSMKVSAQQNSVTAGQNQEKNVSSSIENKNSQTNNKIPADNSSQQDPSGQTSQNGQTDTDTDTAVFWLKDPILQKDAEDATGLPIEKITKKAAAQADIKISAAQLPDITDTQGLEFFRRVVVLALVDNSDIYTKWKEKPVNWDLWFALDSSVSFSSKIDLILAGSLRTIFPSGLNQEELAGLGSITVKDDNNWSSAAAGQLSTTIHLDKSNFKHFSLRFSDLGLAGTSVISAANLTGFSDNSISYASKVDLNRQTIDFDLNEANRSSYAKLSGNSYMENQAALGRPVNITLPLQLDFAGKTVTINTSFNIDFSDNIIQGVPVKVRYIDQKGHQLAPDESISGSIGDTFRVDRKVFKGYYLYQTIGQEQGLISDQEQTVTFIYKKVDAGHRSVQQGKTASNDNKRRSSSKKDFKTHKKHSKQITNSKTGNDRSSKPSAKSYFSNSRSDDTSSSQILINHLGKGKKDSLVNDLLICGSLSLIGLVAIGSAVYLIASNRKR
ncbi:MucBP domain-containing protein [Oenococcus alcoholitolerans]|uniref:MucBP domain-containing protein n=1 Tax=Oenococcus alcoholitolerans TaxID=931074 RepID=UPI003F713EDB